MQLACINNSGPNMQCILLLDKNAFDIVKIQLPIFVERQHHNSRHKTSVPILNNKNNYSMSAEIILLESEPKKRLESVSFLQTLTLKFSMSPVQISLNVIAAKVIVIATIKYCHIKMYMV